MNGRPTRARVLALAAAFEGGLLLLWLVLDRVTGLGAASRPQPSAAALALGAAATLPLLLLPWWCARSRLAPLRGLMETVDARLVPFLSPLTTADFALVALLAGIGEEGIFRGIFQAGLAERLHPAAALAAASALFGLAHAVTPTYAVLAAGIGLYLGALFQVTGNLAVPMTVHALYDFAALLYLVRGRGTRPRPDR